MANKNTKKNQNVNKTVLKKKNSTSKGSHPDLTDTSNRSNMKGKKDITYYSYNLYILKFKL